MFNKVVSYSQVYRKLLEVTSVLKLISALPKFLSLKCTTSVVIPATFLSTKLQFGITKRKTLNSNEFVTSGRKYISKMSSFSDDWSKRLIWVDCEMSGLDTAKDVILEIAVIITDAHLNIVAEGPNVIIHHPNIVLDSMDSWCTEQHSKSGLVQAVRNSQVSMAQCDELIFNFLKTHTPAGKCILAGNSVGTDSVFMAKCLPTSHSHLHYRVLDVSSVKEIAKRWFPDVKGPEKCRNHRALDDIRESIKELEFYRHNIFSNVIKT